MARTSVTVSPRSEAGKGVSHRLRAEGKIPAVVYGKGLEPVAVVADPKRLVAIINGEFGRNTPLDLTIEGEAAPRLAIIKDYQVHAYKRRLTHVDFWQVEPDQKLVLTVPFRRVGRAIAEQTGGRVRLTRDDIDVSCTVDGAPAAIEFDLSTLPDGEQTVHISEVPFPVGVEAVYKHDYSIVQVGRPRLDEDEEGEEGEEGKEETVAAI